MPAPSPATAKLFSYTSDFPIDKVIWRNQGSESVAHATTPSDVELVTIPHGLGFRPLVRGIYSDNDFVDYYELGNDPTWINGGNFQNRLTAQVSADATNVYLALLNFDTTRTFKWRLIGLAPTDMPAVASFATPKGDGNFYLNTDYNYLKLFSAGKTTVNAAAFGNATATIAHGLGYIPLAMIWTEFGGVTYQQGSERLIGVTGWGSTSNITSASLVVNMTNDTGAPASADVHYRIYIDD